MQSILKPDLKALVWLGLGYFVLGKAIAAVQSRIS